MPSVKSFSWNCSAVNVPCFFAHLLTASLATWNAAAISVAGSCAATGWPFLFWSESSVTPWRAAISFVVAVELLGRRVDAGPGVPAGLAGVEVLGMRPAKPLGLLRRVHGTPGRARARG